MPELHFKGKEFVYNHHLTVPFRPLVAQPDKSCGDDPTWIFSSRAMPRSACRWPNASPPATRASGIWYSPLPATCRRRNCWSWAWSTRRCRMPCIASRRLERACWC